LLLVVVLGDIAPALRDVGLAGDLRVVQRRWLGLGIRALGIAACDLVAGLELDGRIGRLPQRIDLGLVVGFLLLVVVCGLG
jgi:hypothetical protein